MGIKGIQRHFRSNPYRKSVLDKSISLRDIAVYGGLTLLVLAILALIIVVPFFIGRASASCPSSTNKTEKVIAATSLINDIAEQAELDMNVSEVEESEEVEEEIVEEPVEVEEEFDESESYLRTDSRVATSYNDVDVDLLDYDYELRGADWGTVDHVKIIITNNQDKIVIPYTLKMQIYNKGESSSNWWDDEKSLRDQINIIAPGDYKIVELDTHVSFSEISEEKRFGIYVFDEVGKEMTGRVKELTLD